MPSQLDGTAPVTHTRTGVNGVTENGVAAVTTGASLNGVSSAATGVSAGATSSNSTETKVPGGANPGTHPGVPAGVVDASSGIVPNAYETTISNGLIGCIIGKGGTKINEIRCVPVSIHTHIDSKG